MKAKFSVPFLIILLSISLSGCFGNNKASYSPLNFPKSVWKAEEIDMIFKVTEYNNENADYFTLGKFKKEEKEYFFSVCFGLGRSLSVEFVDVESANTFTDDSKCVFAKGNCIFQENKLIVNLKENNTFGNIAKITFTKCDSRDSQGICDFEDYNLNPFLKANKTSWLCDNPSVSFSVDQSNDICYQGNISLKDKKIETAVIFGFQSKIYFLALNKYKTPADRIDATVIEGNYEYKSDTLIVHIEKSTVLNDTVDTLIFKKAEVPEDNGENSEPNPNL